MTNKEIFVKDVFNGMDAIRELLHARGTKTAEIMAMQATLNLMIDLSTNGSDSKKVELMKNEIKKIVEEELDIEIITIKGENND